MKWFAVFAIAVLVIAGCAERAPLPQWRAMDADATIAKLTQQQEQVRTLSGSGAVTLTRGDGQSVRLDSAIAAEFPGRVRLRAWKLGQAVFDLTMTPEGVWMLVPDRSRRDRLLPAGANAAQFLRGWAMLHRDFFDREKLEVVSQTPDTLTLRRRMDEGGSIEADIDRATLTVRRQRVLDDAGAQRFILEYDRYRLIGEIPWAMRLRATGDQGQIRVDLDEVELNGVNPSSAFVPPRRAEKLP